MAGNYITGFCTKTPSAIGQVKNVLKAAACPFVNEYLSKGIQALRKGEVEGVYYGSKKLLNRQQLQKIGSWLEKRQQKAEKKKIKEFGKNFIEDPIATVSGCWAPAIKVASCAAQTGCLYKQSFSSVPGHW